MAPRRRRALRLLAAALVVALAAAAWKAEELRRLWVVTTLFDAGRIVANFSHMDAAFLTVPVDRGTGPVSPLPAGEAFVPPPELEAWIAARAVTGIVILADGRLRYEAYFHGTGPQDRRISWSLAKSFLSALLGTLVADGTIPDLAAPVTDYAPGLAGSAYEGARILDVVQMASGVAFDEDYLDRGSDINRMGRVIALGGTLDGFTAGLTARSGPPGAAWRYVSMDTHVLGMVIRGATGRPIPELLSERILAPLGLDSAPYYLADGTGTAFVLGGLNMSTRDYARFGLLIAQDGVYAGRRILPEGWVETSTAASAPTAPGAIGYGYQWWIPQGSAPGQVLARGIYGQYIFIDRARGVVIAVNAADRGFLDPGVEDSTFDLFRRLAEAL